MAVRRLLMGSFALLAVGCLSFDDYPEGDLCKNAIRDSEGRAIHFPEWRICKPITPKDAGTKSAVGNRDGGTPK